MQNSTRAVTITGSAGQAQFSGGRYTGSLENYIELVLREIAGSQPLRVPPPQRTTINGLPAAYTTARANTRSGAVDVSVMAYQWDANTTYHFVMLTRGGCRDRAVRVDGQFATQDFARRSRCDPPADYRCGGGRRE